MKLSSENNSSSFQSLSGCLLVAHPTLNDPNFFHSVILLSTHSAKSGALGVIINRPIHQTLGMVDPYLAQKELGNLPVHQGGPVATDKVILAAWEWLKEGNIFEMQFGLSNQELIAALRYTPTLLGYAFLGHASWTVGQLEAEIQHGAWIVSQMKQNIIASFSGEKLWKSLVLDQQPELKLICQAPIRPYLN